MLTYNEIIGTNMNKKMEMYVEIKSTLLSFLNCLFFHCFLNKNPVIDKLKMQQQRCTKTAMIVAIDNDMMHSIRSNLYGTN